MIAWLIIWIVYWIYDGPVKSAEPGWQLFLSVASRVFTVLTAISILAFILFLIFGNLSGLVEELQQIFYSTQYAGETAYSAADLAGYAMDPNAGSPMQ